jgi:hypothetical protein
MNIIAITFLDLFDCIDLIKRKSRVQRKCLKYNPNNNKNINELIKKMYSRVVITPITSILTSIYIEDKYSEVCLELNKGYELKYIDELTIKFVCLCEYSAINDYLCLIKNIIIEDVGNLILIKFLKLKYPIISLLHF